MPNVNINLYGIFAILAGCLVLSYFTHVGWWAWSGLLLIPAVALIDSYNDTPAYKKNDYAALFGYLFLITSILFFIFGIFASGWTYSF